MRYINLLTYLLTDGLASWHKREMYILHLALKRHIMRDNLSIGLICRLVPKSINIYKNCYIAPICPQALSGQICTKFGIGAAVADLITRAILAID